MDELAAPTGVEHSNERANEVRSSARTEQIEVRVRSERHRRWRPDEKLRMVQETLRPGAVLAEVARRHGIGTWAAVYLAAGDAGDGDGRFCSGAGSGGAGGAGVREMPVACQPSRRQRAE